MKLLTLARDLQRRKARERQRLFVAEGVRTAEELLQSPLTIEGALVSSMLSDTERGRGVRTALEERRIRIEEVGERELAGAADTDTPQGILLIAGIPDRSADAIAVPPSARVVVLDGVQDPGNAGTIVRTAAALGAVATVAVPGTVDLWNAKVVRSAMGALFNHCVVPASWEELDALLRRTGMEMWGADGGGEPVGAVEAPSAVAIAVGNEGAGLSGSCRTRLTRLVAVPITGPVESLNVAVAAGIILYALRP